MNKWDERFLEMAKLVSTWSKDPSTKVGSVIVRPDLSVASVGFNGFPQNTKDDPELYADRDIKYSKIVHAEVNAMCFCQDRDLFGYTIYVYPFLICDRCFVQAVQKRIAKVVAPKLTGEAAERWEPSFKKVREYAKECYIEIVEIEQPQFGWKIKSKFND